jgi:type II secretory pathway component GspD/PulD (secretin)
MRSITLALHPNITAHERDNEYRTADEQAATNVAAIVRLPIFREHDIQTKLNVQSGETVVMGGLISTKENQNIHRVPILGYLPLLGTLFRYDTVEEEKNNLLIFVTATILSEHGEDLVPVNRISKMPEGKQSAAGRGAQALPQQ